jgi:hypothetical protein
MEEPIQGNGKIIICTEKVFTHGQMGVDMKDNMKWIKSTGTEYTSGQTVEYTKATGSMVNSMDKENTCSRMEQ